MSCKSPSLQRVVQNSKKAKIEIEKLNKQLSNLYAQEKSKFENRIDEFSQQAAISDFRRILFDSAIKTEYSHEFSLEKIAPVITASLKTIASSLTNSLIQQITKPGAIDSYSKLVLSISEAAKSSSSASNNFSFTANRLAPGVFAFLSANSVSIKDEETFGEEAVTSTSIFYCVSTSETDVNHSLKDSLSLINAELIIKLKNIQIGYADDLANGKITIAVWQEKHRAIQAEIDELKKASHIVKFNKTSAEIELPELNRFKLENTNSMSLIERSIKQIENRGSLYAGAMSTIRQMASPDFFNS
jgi:hypothetical protein